MFAESKINSIFAPTVNVVLATLMEEIKGIWSNPALLETSKVPAHLRGFGIYRGDEAKERDSHGWQLITINAEKVFRRYFKIGDFPALCDNLTTGAVIQIPHTFLNIFNPLHRKERLTAETRLVALKDLLIRYYHRKRLYCLKSKKNT